MGELVALKGKVGSPDTRTRVEAFHRVWSIALASTDSEVKLTALQLLAEPVGSSSDHIRLPAIYAVADVANSSDDARVKIAALETLFEPLNAAQVPVRDVAIDAVNRIVSSAGPDVTLAAVKALSAPLASGNNGVRVPAIAALMKAALGSHNERAYNAALDAIEPALKSAAMVGGMEVRMFAVVAVQRIGVDASETATKAKAMALLKGTSSGWEPEALRRADEAMAAIQASISKT